MVIFQFSKKALHVNKPIYPSFSILEMSKVVMHDLFYNQIRSVFPDARAAYSDTDSFILQISGRDEDERLVDLTESHLDTSGFPFEQALYSLRNKMRFGVFKNELPKDHNLGSVCLKSKLYALDLEA